jgi:hypothetical protein
MSVKNNDIHHDPPTPPPDEICSTNAARYNIYAIKILAHSDITAVRFRTRTKSRVRAK